MCMLFFFFQNDDTPLHMATNLKIHLLASHGDSVCFVQSQHAELEFYIDMSLHLDTLS
jgi:hypothetical protein